ncbi:hypothetical protein K7432_016964 [Basidiobolus ranarum]|uniref:Uncharacterized protein n=1 Tax=Basidiobolus ranarum TaxID=34480 RepID=A0ABR2WE08_9FUNG
MACIIGNVNVLVQLHHNSTTNEPTKVGEVLSCSENNKYLVLTLEKEGAYGPPETRRLYFDRCYNSQKVDVFNDSRLEENIQFSISGGNSVVFNLGVGMGKHTTYDRMKVLAPFMETLKRQDLMEQKNMSISYAYLGVTDSKCVDLQTERSVTADLLNHGVDPFLSKIQSFDEIHERLDQGCTLPFILAIRFETSGADPTSGTFYLVDMGVPRYIPLDSIMTKETPINSAISGVSKSFYLMRKITTQLTSGSFVGPLPYDDTYFTLLTSDFFSGNCKSLFVFNVETNEKHLNRETIELLEFAEGIRKMKLHEKINKIDRRVIQHERRSKQYKVELKKIQTEYANEPTNTDEIYS